MKRIVFFLLLLVSSVYGQEKKFTISGVVTDCKTNSPLTDFPVKLVCSDGNTLETKTDVKGKYIIELQNFKLPLSCVIVYHTAANPIWCIYTGVKTKFQIEDFSVLDKIDNMCLDMEKIKGE